MDNNPYSQDFDAHFFVIEEGELTGVLDAYYTDYFTRCLHPRSTKLILGLDLFTWDTLPKTAQQQIIKRIEQIKCMKYPQYM